MRFCRALQAGLFAAFMTATWVSEQGPSLAQSRPSVSSTEAADVPTRKDSAPIKEKGISQNRYTTGLVAAAPQSRRRRLRALTQSGHRADRARFQFRIKPKLCT